MSPRIAGPKDAVEILKSILQLFKEKSNIAKIESNICVKRYAKSCYNY
jgi:hypothetical protein